MRKRGRTMNITYTEKAGVMIPNLELPKQEEATLGVWAMRRKNYLMNHRKVMYYSLLTSCSLTEHLSQIEKNAQEMMETIVEKKEAKEEIARLEKVEKELEKNPELAENEVADVKEQIENAKKELKEAETYKDLKKAEERINKKMEYGTCYYRWYSCFRTW